MRMNAWTLLGTRGARWTGFRRRCGRPEGMSPSCPSTTIFAAVPMASLKPERTVAPPSQMVSLGTPTLAWSANLPASAFCAARNGASTMDRWTGQRIRSLELQPVMLKNEIQLFSLQSWHNKDGLCGENRGLVLSSHGPYGQRIRISYSANKNTNTVLINSVRKRG